MLLGDGGGRGRGGQDVPGLGFLRCWRRLEALANQPAGSLERPGSRVEAAPAPSRPRSAARRHFASALTPAIPSPSAGTGTAIASRVIFSAYSSSDLVPSASETPNPDFSAISRLRSSPNSPWAAWS